MILKIIRLFSINESAITQSIKNIRTIHYSIRNCNQGESSSHTSSESSKEEYKVPEYYQYNEYSYVDFEVAMSKHRLPQPSSGQQALK